TGFNGVSAAGSFGTFNGFQGQGGNDTINGNGSTQIQFNNATAGVTINLQAGTAVGDASVGQDTFNGVNNVQGSNFGDTYNAPGFTGALAAYTITALANGQYQVTDSVAGRDGSDNLTSIETLQFSDGTFAAASVANGLTLNGDAGNNNLTGGEGADTINGNDGN